MYILENWEILNEWSDKWYLGYPSDEKISKIIKQPESAFHHAVYSVIKEVFPILV